MLHQFDICLAGTEVPLPFDLLESMRPLESSQQVTMKTQKQVGLVIWWEQMMGIRPSSCRFVINSDHHNVCKVPAQSHALAASTFLCTPWPSQHHW